MEIRISLHAVERYVDRIDPSVSFDRARKIIAAQLEQSSRQKEKSSSGDAYYIGPDFRLVVAEEQGSRTVLTVLRPETNNSDEDIPELAKALHAEFVEWEKECKTFARQHSGTVKNAKLERALKANADLLKGIRRRDQTIANLLAKTNTPAVHAGHISEARYKKQVEHAQRMDRERLRFHETVKQVAKLAMANDYRDILDLLMVEHEGLLVYLKENPDK